GGLQIIHLVLQPEVRRPAAQVPVLGGQRKNVGQQRGRIGALPGRHVERFAGQQFVGVESAQVDAEQGGVFEGHLVAAKQVRAFAHIGGKVDGQADDGEQGSVASETGGPGGGQFQTAYRVGRPGRQRPLSAQAACDGDGARPPVFLLCAGGSA